MPFSDRLLKTQQVATALGVSVSTVKRWVDAGLLGSIRTIGKHRLIQLREAVRFAQEQGMPLTGFNQLNAPALTKAVDVDRLKDRLVECLWQGNERGARDVIHAAFRSGIGIAALSDRLVRPAMETIGHAWMTGEMDVYEEHQATHIVTAALTDLLDRVGPPARSGERRPLALGAAPEDDPYSLAVLLGVLLLREAGWDARCLGPNLPLDSLARAVVEHRPRMVFLSVNHLEDEERFVKAYQSFYKTAASHDVAVMLGGRALHPTLRNRLEAAGFGERLAHLAEFARRLAPPRVAAPDGADGSNNHSAASA